MNYEINDYTDLLIFENKLMVCKTFHKTKQLHMLYIHKIMENEINHKIKKIHQYFFNNFFSKFLLTHVKWLLRLNPTTNTLITNRYTIERLNSINDGLKNTQLLLQLNPQKYYYFRNPKDNHTKMRYYCKIRKVAKFMQ